MSNGSSRTYGTPYGKKRTRSSARTPLGGYSSSFSRWQRGPVGHSSRRRRVARGEQTAWSKLSGTSANPYTLGQRQRNTSGYWTMPASKPSRNPKRKRTTYSVYVPPTTMGSGRKVPGRYRASATPMYRSGTSKRLSVSQGRRKQRVRSRGRSSVRF
jgi:hypothetical protein